MDMQSFEKFDPKFSSNPEFVGLHQLESSYPGRSPVVPGFRIFDFSKLALFHSRKHNLLPNTQLSKETCTFCGTYRLDSLLLQLRVYGMEIGYLQKHSKHYRNNLYFYRSLFTFYVLRFTYYVLRFTFYCLLCTCYLLIVTF